VEFSVLFEFRVNVSLRCRGRPILWHTNSEHEFLAKIRLERLIRTLLHDSRPRIRLPSSDEDTKLVEDDGKLGETI